MIRYYAVFKYVSIIITGIRMFLEGNPYSNFSCWSLDAVSFIPPKNYIYMDDTCIHLHHSHTRRTRYVTNYTHTNTQLLQLKPQVDVWNKPGSMLAYHRAKLNYLTPTLSTVSPVIFLSQFHLLRIEISWASFVWYQWRL